MKKPWLIVNHSEYNENDLAGIIMRSDMLVSDLDDTAAKSPSKAAVFHFFRDTSLLSNPSFIKWAFTAGYRLLKHGKRAESGLWKEFTERFLKDKKAVEKIAEWLTPEYAGEMFFPGALDFYAALPKNMKKAYITRTIEEIAEPFREAACFDIALAGHYDKAEAVSCIRKMFPRQRRYVFVGDSEEDYEALDYLKFLWKYVKIDTLVSIYIAENAGKIDNRFDINICRDYNGLAGLVRNAIPSHFSQ